MTRLYIFVVVAAAVLTPGLCGSLWGGEALTLNRAIGSALANNGAYASAQHMAQAARAKARSAGAWDDPMLMFGVNNIPTNFDLRMDPMTMTMFGVSQSIPLAGQKGLSAKAEHRTADAADAMAQMTALEIQDEVRTAYHELYYKRQILTELRNQRAIQLEMVQTATDRFKIGLGGQAEVTSAQASAFRFESQIRSAEQEVVAAANRLAAMTGNDIDDSVSLESLPTESIPPSDSAWVNQALGSYVELTRLQNQREAFALSAQAEGRMRWPMLTLSASYGIRRDGPNEMGEIMPRDNMLSFGANISLPLFSGKRNGNMAQSMRLMSQATAAQEEQTKRDVASQVKSLHSSALKVSASIAGYEHDVIPASEQSYQAALAAYRTNQMNLGNLLTYSMQLIGDRITLIQLRLELAVTMDQVSRFLVDPSQPIAGHNGE